MTPADDTSGDGATERYSAPAAACAAEILQYLADADGPKPAPEIARAIGRSRSLVFRVLQELKRYEFVECPSNGTAYELGFGVLGIGTAFLAKSSLMQSVQSVLRELARTSEETVNLGVLRGIDVLYLIKHEGRNSVITLSHVGGRVPATCTALGKAILAQLDDADLAARLPSQLPRLTPNSLTTHAELLADLGLVRERGSAFDDGEAVLGRSCLAAPVHLLGAGVGHAAISISMATETFARRGEEMRSLLLEAAGRLSREAEARLGMVGDAAMFSAGSASLLITHPEG